MSDTFREHQTSAWQYLNYELARKKPSCCWLCCGPKKVDCSAASRLAQLMLTSRDMFDTWATEVRGQLMYAQSKKDVLLPSCDRPEDWTELSQWKHPELALNLLQVAIVCRHRSGVKYLWQDCFKEKEKYLDESSELVNHPWHLIFALSLGKENVLPIEEADVEIFLEQGKVDLKTALLWKWPGTRRLVEPKTDIILSGSKIGLDWNQDVCGFFFCYKVWCRFVEKLFTDHAQPSTVECLLKLLWDNPLYSEDKDLWLMDMGFKAMYHVAESNDEMRQWKTQLAEECLILICQLWFITRYSTPQTLCRIFCKALKCGIPLMNAASFLRPSELGQVIKLMAHDSEVNQDSHSQAVFKDFVARTSGVRSLQNLCMFSVLRAVKGDVRKVWAMSELPEPVKTLFHVPFQALHG